MVPLERRRQPRESKMLLRFVALRALCMTPCNLALAVLSVFDFCSTYATVYSVSGSWACHAFSFIDSLHGNPLAPTHTNMHFHYHIIHMYFARLSQTYTEAVGNLSYPSGLVLYLSLGPWGPLFLLLYCLSHCIVSVSGNAAGLVQPRDSFSPNCQHPEDKNYSISTR